MAEKKFNYMLTTNSIAVSYQGRHYMVTKVNDPEKYEELKAALKAKDDAAFIEALVPKERVIKYVNEYFEIDDKGLVFMKDDLKTQVPDFLANRMSEFAKEDIPIEPLVYFWKKLRKNPSENSRKMLYGFLEQNKHPLTPDGNFIAYKKVDRSANGRLVDNYTKKLDNTPGCIVAMPREQVVEDKNQTCSRGLHVAAWEYAQGYSGNVLIEVMVDPTDVVSVPRDYDGQKMRVCRYKVIGEIATGSPKKEQVKKNVDEKGMKAKTDVAAAVKGKAVSLVSLTFREITHVLQSIVGKETGANFVAGISEKNKQGLIKKVKDILEGRGYVVTVDAPKKRTNQ